MTSGTNIKCHICGESTTDSRLISTCVACDQQFHLNPYNNESHIDCGDAIIGPTQGVEFWCQTCLEALDREVTDRSSDPRASLDALAAPDGLLSIVETPSARAPTKPSTAPPRRSRTTQKRRYRRIDN